MSGFDAEAAVVGAALLDARAFWQVADIVTAEDFSDGSLRRLWSVTAALIREGSDADAVTIGDEHPELGQLAFEVASATPSTANVRAYAEIVAQRAIERRVITAGQRIAGLRGKDVLGEAQRILAACQPRSSGNMRSLRESMRDWFDVVRARFNEGGMSGIETSLPGLDDKLDGYQRSDLIVLAARPSVGKTALAMQSAIHSARAGIPTLVFSAEMSNPQLCGRLMAHVSKVSASALRRPKDRLDDEGWSRVSAAIGLMRDWPLTIDDSDGMTVEAIGARARQLDAQQRLGLIVIDYLQHLRLPKADRHDLAIGEASKALKGLAKQLKVPVLLLSQLNRDGANARPTLAMLRGSGDIEQDADVVMFLHRPDESDREKLELIVAKQRNGECGEQWLRMDGARMAFHEVDPPKKEEKPKPTFANARQKQKGNFDV